MTLAVPVSRIAPPLPHRPVTQHDWRDVVSVHWPVDGHRLAPLVPPGTRPDEHDGSGWATLTAYVFGESTVPPLPPLGRIGTMIEAVVQIPTVDGHGRHGVAYRTIETQHRGAVIAAQLIGLPYRAARAASRREGDAVEHRTIRRTTRGVVGTHVRVRSGARLEPTPLTSFLHDRWGVHARHLGRTTWWRRAHPPWELRGAHVEHFDDTLLARCGLPAIATTLPALVTVGRAGEVRYSRG